MRILAVTPSYPPHSRVGAWLATHEHLMVLAERGHHVAVHSPGVVEEYVLDGVHVAPMGETAATWIHDVDVVVSHHGDLVTKAAEYAQARGVPSVVLAHGATKGHTKPPADLVVFNAESNRVKRWGTSIVCRPHTRHSQHVASRGEHVTLLNCSLAKGVATFRAVAQRMPEHQFLAVKGDYGPQERIATRNARTISSTANLRRHVWSQTRVLLMPSESETWGMAGVEAMCSGIPVIAHPTPGLKESLGDAGIFVDRDDIDGWVEQLVRLDDVREYAAASTAASRRAAELCDRSGPTLFADTIEEMFG